MNIFRMLFAIVITVLMSLLFVWEQNHITKIGYRTAILQNRKIDLIEDNRKIEHEVDKLASGNRISQVIKSFNLNLVYAHDNSNERDSEKRLYSQVNVTNHQFIKEF